MHLLLDLMVGRGTNFIPFFFFFFVWTLLHLPHPKNQNHPFQNIYIFKLIFGKCPFLLSPNLYNQTHPFVGEHRRWMAQSEVAYVWKSFELMMDPIKYESNFKQIGVQPDLTLTLQLPHLVRHMPLVPDQSPNGIYRPPDLATYHAYWRNAFCCLTCSGQLPKH